MAGKVVAMKVISSVIAKAEGGEVNVARVCAQAGVSRQFFYNQLARYRTRWSRAEVSAAVVVANYDAGCGARTHREVA
jgi:hypothetical protein